MAKHYEQLWEEAEVIAKKYFTMYNATSHHRIRNGVSKLENEEDLSAEEKEHWLGDVLFGICLLSKDRDINAYTALRVAIDNAKQEMLDEEETERLDSDDDEDKFKAGPTRPLDLDNLHHECLDCDTLIDLHRRDESHCECGDLDCNDYKLKPFDLDMLKFE